MIRRALDWLANAKSVNDEVNADALRIAALEQKLAAVRKQLARSVQANVSWKAKAIFYRNSLLTLRNSKEYTTGVKRLAAIAKYRRGRA